MIFVFTSSLLILALFSSGAVWCLHRAYVHTIEGLRADNKDLRDRLFQKNALPPSGVDLTEKYEARQERERAQRDNPNREKKPLGPIEQLEDKWAKDDRIKAGRNIDATRGRLN